MLVGIKVAPKSLTIIVSDKTIHTHLSISVLNKLKQGITTKHKNTLRHEGR